MTEDIYKSPCYEEYYIGYDPHANIHTTSMNLITGTTFGYSRSNYHVPPMLNSSNSVFCAIKVKVEEIYGYRNDSDLYLNVTVFRALYSFFFLLGTLLGLGGGVVILLAVRRKALRLDKITTALIQHVAVLDIFATLFLIFPIGFSAAIDRWIFGKDFCAFQAYFGSFLLLASLLFVCALCSSKLCYIMLPFRAEMWVTKQGHLLGCSVWGISLLLNLVFHLQGAIRIKVSFDHELISCGFMVSDEKLIKSAGILTMSVLMSGIVAVVVTSGWLIGIIVKSSRRYGHSCNLQGITTIVLIALVYCCSFGPLLFYYFCFTILGHLIPFYGQIVCKFVPYLNNVANVFIYMCCLTSFRKFLLGKVLGFGTVGHSGRGFKKLIMFKSVKKHQDSKLSTTGV